MNALAKFFSAGSLALLATATSSFAGDTDPGYSLGAPIPGLKDSNSRATNRYAPQYLRPTLRYYGKGYTVAYRFVPWSDRMRALNATSMWDSEQMRLPTDAAATTSATGSSPRITYFYRKPSASTSKGVLPEHNSDVAPTPKPLPPISEFPKPADAPNPAQAPAKP